MKVCGNLRIMDYYHRKWLMQYLISDMLDI